MASEVLVVIINSGSASEIDLFLRTYGFYLRDSG